MTGYYLIFGAGCFAFTTLVCLIVLEVVVHWPRRKPPTATDRDCWTIPSAIGRCACCDELVLIDHSSGAAWCLCGATSFPPSMTGLDVSWQSLPERGARA